MIAAASFDTIQVFKYELKDPKNMKKPYNNVYVKNFDKSWDEEKLREVFGRFGKISSVFIKEDTKNADRKFAFICFHDEGNAE